MAASSFLRTSLYVLLKAVSCTLLVSIWQGKSPIIFPDTAFYWFQILLASPFLAILATLPCQAPTLDNMASLTCSEAVGQAAILMQLYYVEGKCCREGKGGMSHGKTEMKNKERFI